MDESIKQDIKNSLFIGAFAGILMLPILVNLNIPVDLLMGLLILVGLSIFTVAGYLVGRFLSRWFPIMLQFVKFGIVGGLNAMIDLGLLNFLIYLTGFVAGAWFSVFKSFSFIVAVINSYLWNKHWTFQSKQQATTSEFTKFFLISLIGFSINVGIASFIVNVISAPASFTPVLWANVGAVIAAFSALAWNFIGMKFIVFKK